MLLACPVTDLTLAEPSVRTKGHGWGLEADDLRWFAEQWVPNATRRGDPDVSPVHAELSGLPPTVIATAEHDPLRDQGATLARRLREAGVPVRHTNYKGLVHGFVGLSDVSPTAELAGREMFGEFGRLIRARPRAGLRTRPAPTR